jgi:hypothetical protein
MHYRIDNKPVILGNKGITGSRQLKQAHLFRPFPTTGKLENAIIFLKVGAGGTATVAQRIRRNGVGVN